MKHAITDHSTIIAERDRLRVENQQLQKHLAETMQTLENLAAAWDTTDETGMPYAARGLRAALKMQRSRYAALATTPAATAE